MNHNSFSPAETTQDTQFVLSFELLRLLQWLGRYETNKLRKMIAKAVSQGLHDDIQQTNDISDPYLMEDMHHGIIDFFELLDDMLIDVLSEHIEKKARETNLFPALDRIDSTICDNATVISSVEKATQAIERNANSNPKEQLFKELLKQWKPHDKNMMH